jgi:hypothetical protein
MRCHHLHVVLALGLSAAPALLGCTNEASTEPGDPPADAGTPSALGNGLHLAQMNAPDSAVVDDQMNVYATGVTYLTTDDYNETGTSSSVGAVYVQDFHTGPPDAALPYSGIQLYKPTYVPASLTLAPGDVIDFTGEYQQYTSTSFLPGQYQPEMYEPVVTFRFDYSPPVPTVIPVSDLESFATGYPWMSMLVTVKNTYGGGGYPDGKGRNYVFLTADESMDAVTMDNELFDMNWASCQYAPMYGGPVGVDGGPPPPVHFASVTGIVTFFDNFNISPRSQADIVIENSNGGVVCLDGGASSDGG